MSFASSALMTPSTGTSQNNEIFLFVSSFNLSAHLPTIMSGCKPILRSSFTLCCVGFVFCSFPKSSGMSVTWIRRKSSSLSSLCICLIASRNGMLSMSPTVPPISTMQISALFSIAIFLIHNFISSVMCGIICTVFPR